MREKFGIKAASSSEVSDKRALAKLTWISEKARGFQFLYGTVGERARLVRRCISHSVGCRLLPTPGTWELRVKTLERSVLTLGRMWFKHRLTHSTEFWRRCVALRSVAELNTVLCLVSGAMKYWISWTGNRTHNLSRLQSSMIVSCHDLPQTSSCIVWVYYF